MSSSTVQVPHSHCAAAPITAYVINHHKTHSKQKKKKTQLQRKLLQYHRRKKSRMSWCTQSKYYLCSFSRPAGRYHLEKSWILREFTHFCHLVPWVFIIFDMAEVEALPCPGKLYKFRWSAGRRLFLIKGWKRINIDRYKNLISWRTKGRCGDVLATYRC